MRMDPELLGDVGDTISQEEFEEGLACTGSGHYRNGPTVMATSGPVLCASRCGGRHRDRQPLDLQ